MRSLLLIALSGLLVVLERGDAFVSHPLIVRQTVKHQPGGRKSVNIGNIVASASRQGPSSDLPPQQQKAWLADLMASWFKLPPSDGSAAKANTNKSMGTTATDDVRATIRELRDSNDELRAEVLALRTYMLQRGFTPVEDIFADPSSQKPTALLSPTISPPATTTTDLSLFQPTSITPPPPPPAALPREARLAALALLWAAAISIGGVFVPVAIREGAGHSLRWLDGGGSLIPAPARRVLSGYRGRWRGRGWGNAVLSYVPVLARVTKAAGEGGDGKEGGEEEQGEGLVGAWDELKPRRRSRGRRRRTP